MKANLPSFPSAGITGGFCMLPPLVTQCWALSVLGKHTANLATAPPYCVSPHVVQYACRHIQASILALLFRYLQNVSCQVGDGGGGVTPIDFSVTSTYIR